VLEVVRVLALALVLAWLLPWAGQIEMACAFLLALAVELVAD
jgi:hypothetical protein